MLTGGRERAEVSAHRGEGVLSHAHASHDLFDPPPPEERDAERFTSRLQGEGFQLERIVSHGHASESGSGLAGAFASSSASANSDIRVYGLISGAGAHEVFPQDELC